MNEGKHVQALNTIGIDRNENDSDMAVEVKAISLQVLNQIERSVEHYEELYKRKPNPLVAYELADLKIQLDDLLGATKHITFGVANSKSDIMRTYYESQSQYQVPMKAAFIYLKGLVRFKENKTLNIDAAIEIMDENEMDDDNESSAIIELVEKIIEEAIESDASDIHIQPSEFDLDIRYRIDGVLQSIMILPHSRTRPINSRIKVMSNLDIAETRKPQDGRFKHTTSSGKAYDFRVSTYPTEFGEKTVMRILDPSKGNISLDKLGFSKINLDLWHEAIANSTGIILVTGPTGSGKSTTLYATLNLLNKPGVNILTIEDPVEYNMKGIAQGQVNDCLLYTSDAADE